MSWRLLADMRNPSNRPSHNQAVLSNKEPTTRFWLIRNSRQSPSIDLRTNRRFSLCNRAEKGCLQKIYGSPDTFYQLDMAFVDICHHSLFPVVSESLSNLGGFYTISFHVSVISHCKSIISPFESANTTSKKLCQGIFGCLFHHRHFATRPLKFSYCPAVSRSPAHDCLTAWMKRYRHRGLA